MSIMRGCVYNTIPLPSFKRNFILSNISTNLSTNHTKCLSHNLMNNQVWIYWVSVLFSLNAVSCRSSQYWCLHVPVHWCLYFVVHFRCCWSILKIFVLIWLSHITLYPFNEGYIPCYRMSSIFSYYLSSFPFNCCVWFCFEFCCKFVSLSLFKNHFELSPTWWFGMSSFIRIISSFCFCFCIVCFGFFMSILTP